MDPALAGTLYLGTCGRKRYVGDTIRRWFHVSRRSSSCLKLRT
jgi:hypothetical protein